MVGEKTYIFCNYFQATFNISEIKLFTEKKKLKYFIFVTKEYLLKS